MFNRDTSALEKKQVSAYPIKLVLNAISGFLPHTKKQHQSIFKNNSASLDGTKIATMSHIDGLPVFASYTTDRKLQAESMALMTMQQFFDFFDNYLQFLPNVLNDLNEKNNIKAHPITHVRNEFRNRQLNTSYVDKELYVLHGIIMDEVERARRGESNFNVPTFLLENNLELTDVLAMLVFADVYKGIDGCSAAVREVNYGANDKRGTQLIRNLDWASLGVLGSNTFAKLLPTRYFQKNPDKPQAIFSITVTPGIMDLSIANDKGLVITLNEVCTMESKRENSSRYAIPQFILIREIAENCSTINEVLAYIDRRQPATSHILSVMDASGNGGILEMLSTDENYKYRPYKFRSLEDSDEYVGRASRDADKDFRSDKARAKQKNYGKHVVATNDFRNTSNEQIEGSSVWDCSEPRYQNLTKALNEQRSSKDAARACVSSDTVQSMRFTSLNNAEELKVTVTWGNNYAAPKRTFLFGEQAFHDKFTRINLRELFDYYLDKLANPNPEAEQRNNI